MYERVTETQVPESHHLKNPVVEKIPMVSEVQEHGLYINTATTLTILGLNTISETF